MPKAAFKEMWNALEAGQSWRGIVKNMCKDGGFYWVDAFITPIFENGQKVGYQSVRSYPETDYVSRAESIYRRLNQNKPLRYGISTSSRWWFAVCISVLAIVGLALLAGIWAAVITLVLLVALTWLFKDNIVDLSVQADTLRKKYDSVSRFVYSGRGNSSIYDFHLKLAKSLNLTILGRTKDAALQLDQLAKNTLSNVEHTIQSILTQKRSVNDISSAIRAMDDASSGMLSTTEVTTNSIHSTTTQVGVARDNILVGRDKVQSLAGIVDKAASTADNLLDAADEVRALSTRTQESAANIVQSMELMRNTLNDWVGIMNETRQSAMDSAEQAQQSADIIESVHKMIDDIQKNAQTVIKSVKTQNDMSAKVGENAQQIECSAESNAQMATEMTGTANELTRSIAKLVGLSDTFKH